MYNELAQAKGATDEQNTCGKHFHVEYFSGLLYTVKPVHAVTSVKQSPVLQRSQFSCPIIEHFIGIELHLKGYMSYKATFSLS